MARGYAAPAEARYRVEVGDGRGERLYLGEHHPDGPRSCVPVAASDVGTGYRVVSIATTLDGGAGSRTNMTTKASRIHLRWRDAEHRFVVVGLERDE